MVPASGREPPSSATVARVTPRRVVFLAAAACALLGGAPAAAQLEATLRVHPNPAHIGEIAVLVVEGRWSDSCTPQLRSIDFQEATFHPNFPARIDVTLVAGSPGVGCLSAVTHYQLDIPLPVTPEYFLLDARVTVTVEYAEGGLPPVVLGSLLLLGNSDEREELPLHGGFFKVSAEWTDALGRQGTAKVVPGFSQTSGLFWFFRPHNWELLVKVLDGCAVNGHLWVLGASATNVGYTLRVEVPDVGPPGGNTWTHVNPVGHHPRFFADVEAIDCDFWGS